MAGTCRERARTCMSQVSSLLALIHPPTAATSPTAMLIVLALLIVCASFSRHIGQGGANGVQRLSGSPV